MSLKNVTPGDKAPEAFNVVIEIPMHGDPIKYEVDKESGALFVDRFMSAAMYYPANYGYVPQTLAGDGDPVDVLVVTPAIGILNMQDEAGNDAKVLAVPVSKKLPLYDGWKTPDDAPQSLTRAITHFFEHYKDLETGKWVKVLGWDGPEAAKKEIADGIAAAKK